MICRRNLITGLISFIAAPAIIKASSLMPVKVMELYPQIAFDTLIDRLIAPINVDCKLYWIDNDGEIISLPIKHDDLYLGRFNDYT